VARWKEENATSLPAGEDQFLREWNVSDEMLGKLFSICEKEGVKTTALRSGKYDRVLRTEIKVRVARVTYGDESLYKVLNSEDPAVGKALELINSGAPVYKR
jgi:hypothetical protein